MVFVLVIAAAITIALRSQSDSRPLQNPPGDPVVARLQIEALPTLSFQAKELTTVAGVNQITLVGRGGTEALVFDDPALADFELAVPTGPTRATVELQAGRDYRIHSVIPGHAAAGVEAVIHVLPAGAAGSPPLPQAVLDRVSKTSQISGGPAHGTAEYAVASRNAANQALLSAEIPRDERPVYVFVLHVLHGSFVDPRAGSFTDAQPPADPGATNLRNTLTLVISQDSPPLVLDTGTGPSGPDLSIVGGAITTRY